MQLTTILPLIAAILTASVSALPSETMPLGNLTLGESSYHGEIDQTGELQSRGWPWLNKCSYCEPGKGQCGGKPGCYSCNNGPYLCQIPDDSAGCACSREDQH